VANHAGAETVNKNVVQQSGVRNIVAWKMQNIKFSDLRLNLCMKDLISAFPPL
jgi:hypothetical protein